MSLTIQVPPAMEQEALAYAQMRGTTLEAILFECLKREMDERRAREKRISDFESFVDSHSVDLGHPYKFARQDAYDEELA
jgi:hypothetical protein